MRLLFIRHGEPDYLNDSLTERGRREAELLAERIAKTDISEFFVSTKGRAIETAQPSLDLLGRTAVRCDWLREVEINIDRPDITDGRPSFVPWDWLPEDWLKEPRFLDPAEWKEAPVFKKAGVGDFCDSAVAAFDAMLADHGYVRDGLLYRAERANSDTLAFFCHFGITCVFLGHLMNCSPVVLWHGLCTAPTSVTTVYSEERRPGIASFRASSVGDISHLYVHDMDPSFHARFCEVYGNGDRID